MSRSKKGKMGKTELVGEVAAKVAANQATVKEIIDVTFECIAGALASGSVVTIFDFGNWSVRQRQARIGRNPSTGDTMDIPAHKVIAYKPANALKTKVNAKRD